jgi:hypothetical protein
MTLNLIRWPLVFIVFFIFLGYYIEISPKST